MICVFPVSLLHDLHGSKSRISVSVSGSLHSRGSPSQLGRSTLTSLTFRCLFRVAFPHVALQGPHSPYVQLTVKQVLTNDRLDILHGLVQLLVCLSHCLSACCICLMLYLSVCLSAQLSAIYVFVGIDARMSVYSVLLSRLTSLNICLDFRWGCYQKLELVHLTLNIITSVY